MNQMYLFDLEELGIMGYSSLFYQEVNQDFLFYLLSRTIGEPLNQHARDSLYGVKWVEEAVERITEDNLREAIFMTPDNTTSKGRLGEFYTALRTEKTLPPITNQAGYDLLSTFVDGDKASIARVQVKTSGPNSNPHWSFQITNKYGKINYDVLVAIGLRDNWNPCKGEVFIIPSSHLVDRVERWEKIVVDIQISKNHFHHRSRNKVNKWWGYQLPNHIQMANRIGEIVCSKEFIILSSYTNSI